MPTAKPRIRPLGNPLRPGKFECVGLGFVGNGYCANDAYSRWWNMAFANGVTPPFPRGRLVWAERRLDGRRYLVV